MVETERQIRTTRIRSLLKRLYYSRTARALVYAPIDGFERLTGRRDAMTPPRRLRYVGGGAEAVGAVWRERLIEEHGLRRDADVLDIGCGIGRNALALVPHLTDGTYEGFDIVPQFIRWCGKRITPRHPNFRFQLADVRNRQYNSSGATLARDFTFPYDDEVFDLAFAASVFTHMPPDEIRRYLAESHRVLRPAGTLVCTFFLVDPAVEGLLAQGRTAFTLDHSLADSEGVGYLAADEQVPEFCIGVRAGDLTRMIGEVGFEQVGPVAHGRWSRRPGSERAAYQDVITLRRPV